MPELLPQEQRLEAALAIARRIAGEFSGNDHHETIEAALWDIAAGDAGFGDICDDNIYIYAVLSELGLIPADVSECIKSQQATDTWNAVVSSFDWAAERLLKERVSSNPELRKLWEFTCENCSIPMRANDAVTRRGHLRCRGCDEVQR